MDVFALSLRLKEEGAATVKAATDKLRGSFDSAAKSADGLDRSSNNLKRTLGALAGAFAIGATVRKFVAATSTAEFAQAQLAATIRSTGGVAQQSVSQLNEHASALQRMSTVGDEAINKAQALLLTFTKLRGDVFPQATAAVVDMAQALGTDLNSAALQVGKALNDPIAGVSALGRAGVQFSTSQKAMIRSLVETGRTAEAQRIILAELDTQFGGSALMARNTLGGALQALSNAFGDLFEITREGTASVTRLINRLAFMVGALNDNRRAMVQLAGGVTIAVVALTALAFRAELAAAKIAIMAAAETAAGFVRLARSIGLAAAAMELLGKAGPLRLLTLGVAVAGGVAAFVGLRKAVDDSAGAFAEFERKLAELESKALAPLKTTVEAVTSAVVDQVAALMRLVELTTVTRVEAGLLAREERTLRERLAASNLTYAERVTLLERLQAVEKARAAMQVRFTRDELMAAEMSTATPSMVLPGRAMPQIRGRGAGVPSTAEALKALEGDAAKIRARTVGLIDVARLEFADQMESLADFVATSMRDTFVDGIANGISEAIRSGSIGQGFKELSRTMIASLGTMLIEFGRSLIPIGKLFSKLRTAMMSLNPFAVTAVALGTIALGAAMRGAAQSAFGAGGASGNMMALSGGIGSLGTGGTTMTRTFAPTTAGSAGASVQVATPMNITIIGPNDPTAQRQIAALMDNANRRGLVQGSGVRTL
jgi:hypothetical protein